MPLLINEATEYVHGKGLGPHSLAPFLPHEPHEPIRIRYERLLLIGHRLLDSVDVRLHRGEPRGRVFHVHRTGLHKVQETLATPLKRLQLAFQGLAGARGRTLLSEPVDALSDRLGDSLVPQRVADDSAVLTASFGQRLSLPSIGAE